MIFRHNINFLYIWNIYIFALLVSLSIYRNHQKIFSLNFKGPSQVNSDVYIWICPWIGCTSYSVGFQMYSNICNWTESYISSHSIFVVTLLTDHQQIVKRFSIKKLLIHIQRPRIIPTISNLINLYIWKLPIAYSLS